MEAINPFATFLPAREDIIVIPKTPKAKYS